MVAYFETRALEARAKRRIGQHEFGSDDLLPIKVVDISKTEINSMKVGELRRRLDENEVMFVRDAGKQGSREKGDVFAMITPISFEYLLQVRDVLNDTTTFQIVNRGAVARDLCLPERSGHRGG